MNFLQRHWVSVTLAALVGGLLITGVLAYTRPYSELNMGIHTSFGLLFLLAVGFHMRHNLRALGNYLRQRPKALWGLAAGLIVTVVCSILFQLPPLYSAVVLGQNLRGQVEIDEQELTIIHTRPGTDGPAVEITIKPGTHYFSPTMSLLGGLIKFRSIPQVAIWVEDMQGNYLDTLYVTGKAASAGWEAAPFSGAGDISRPEALPRWVHQRQKLTGGELIPTAENPLPDAITAATPLNTHTISSHLPARPQVRVFMEINRSFDFNDFWHREKFPDDLIYTSSGSSGQPALIYMTELDLTAPVAARDPVFLKPIGHAHYSGRDGNIYPDLSGFDTALELLDWAMVLPKAASEDGTAAN